MSETKPRKLDRVKTGVPEWFDLGKYDVFWTVGASVWLEQLEIRKAMLTAVGHLRRLPLPSILPTLTKSVELICQRPYANYRDLPLFGCNGESFSSPVSPSNLLLPSGTRVLTNCEFWLMAAWLYRKEEEGDNPASEVARRAADFRGIGDDGFIELEESFDAELLREMDDAILEEIEQRNMHADEDVNEGLDFYFDQHASEESKFAAAFYDEMRGCGYSPGEGDKPLAAADVLGAETFLVSVDLSLPDSILKEQFATVLEQLRRRTRIVAQEAKRPAIRNWMNAGVLPYLDLTLWAAVTNHWIPNAALADAVLVGETQGSDTIRNTTELHVKQLMESSSAAYRGLISAARLEASGLA